jgi:regulator of sigma E protease
MIQFKKTAASIFAILGIGFIIMFHELGHFLACKLFDIATPIFSIGFGPALASIKLGATTFQLSMLPLGGYVAIDPEQLNAAALPIKLTIILAGVVFNFLLSFIIVAIIRMRNVQPIVQIPDEQAALSTKRTVVGPVGMVKILQNNFITNPTLFFLNLAQISTSIGFFNLLPLPVLDGGKVATYLIEAMGSDSFSPESLGVIETLLLIFFITLTLFLLLKDLKRYRSL